MNCPQCGSALPPNTNFCGACGFRMEPQGQWQQPPPQPPQGQWQQPPPQGQWQQPQSPPQQAQWQPPQQQAAGPGSMRPYPLVMHQRLTRLTGHMVVAPMRLFFICSSNKGGLAVALGKGIASGVGGLVGGAVGAIVEGGGAPGVRHGQRRRRADAPPRGAGE